MAKRVVTKELREEFKRLFDEGTSLEDISILHSFHPRTIKEHLDIAENPELYYIYRKRKDVSVLHKKVSKFLSGCSSAVPFTAEDLLLKYPNPVCYITGESINIEDPKQYSLDHYIPRSKKGISTIDNCRFITRKANMSKSDMLYEEWISLAMVSIEKYHKENNQKVNLPKKNQIRLLFS